METKNNNIQHSDTLKQKAAKLRKQRMRQRLASAFGIIIIMCGIVKTATVFMNYKSTETSDDAQIEQYISPVNLRASGYIKKVCFTEHQNVKKGDTLLVLDDREYRIRVMEAEAGLKDAMAGASAIGQSLQTSEASASVYESSIDEVKIRLAKLEKDRTRYQNLLDRNAATPIQLEQIETEYEATKKKLDGLVRQRKAAMSGVSEVSVRRKSSEAACACRSRDGTSQPLLYGCYRSVRRQARSPDSRGRTIRPCRTDSDIHHARHTKMGDSEL